MCDAAKHPPCTRKMPSPHRPASARLPVALLLGAVLATALQAAELGFRLEAASGEHFAEPHDIVLSADGRLLYVADVGNDRIAVLDAQSLVELGEFAKGEVGAPHDVVFDPLGRLLVADTDNDRIAIYHVEGTRGRLVDALSGGFRRPEGVAVGAGGRIYVTGAASGNLLAFADGVLVAEARGFSAPHDVEIDAGGGVWVADANNDRLVRLDGDLRIQRELSGAAYAFRGPRYLDFDAAGRLYVADKYSNSVKVIAPDGTLLQVLGDTRSGKGEGLFDRPEGVEIRADQVWISDTYNDRIVRYRIGNAGR